MKDVGRKARSLVHLLQQQAEDKGDRVAKTFLPMRGGSPDLRTYGELDAEARAIAVHILERARPGERAVLLYPPGLEFTVAFFGCLYAGVVGVPAPPPDPKRLQRTLPRLSSIVRDCDPALILTVSGVMEALDAAAQEDSRLGKIPRLETDRADRAASSLWQLPVDVGPETLAYLQYTSGSTAAPKGVMSQHGHVLENCRYLQAGFRYTPDSVLLSWVPNFHDDGLVQGVMASLFTGFHCIRMSPMDVVRRPLDWLRAIHEHGVTHSGGPNFIFELTRRKVVPADCEGLDLSRWRVAYNAAEPIRVETLRGFADAFAAAGFRFESFHPSFGMAETTLLVSTKAIGTRPIVLAVDGASMVNEGRIVEVADGPGSRTVVGCGRAVGEARFEIVDPQSLQRVAPGIVGELWIADPCVAAGYWGREEATRETFQARIEGLDAGPFLRTGDLAFLRDGELFIAGRLKDLIIIRGRNLYPQDVEIAAEQAHRSLRPGCGAAFGVEEDGAESLIVVQETQPGLSEADAREAAGAIRQAVSEALDAEVGTVVLIEAGTLPKTSSGKIQRSACRKSYLDESLAVVLESRRGLVSPSQEGPSQDSKKVSSEEVQRWMVEKLGQTLGLPEASIDVSWPFSRFGLGSAATVGLTAELENWLGLPLPETLLYEHPNIESLSRALGSRAPLALTSVLGAEARDHKVAIVGMACRFPGAEDPQEFWQLLTHGLDAIREVPASRWDVAKYFDPDPQAPGKMNTRWGGFLRQVDGFDPYFFGISPREAERMDPQQRLLLELAWEALEDGGIPADSLAGTSTGVFVGIGLSDYGRWMLEDPALSDAYAGTGGALSIAANRISYALDLRGPSMAVDTACSSSLVAILQACESLRQGDCSLALAGGVNLLLAPEVTVNFSKAGFMAPDGRCKAFDARGDGYVRSEGAGVVLLKSLAAAVRDGDPIYAVIRGGATNQDGRSNGLTAPSPKAQEDLIRRALANAGVEPRQIDTIEAHGTGTALGDPIEAQAIGRVLAADREQEQACRLGSVKTNIGHLETAAGIAGVMKTALSLFHGERVPSLHFETPNPRIPFQELRLEVQTRREPWPRERRLAGVSSFGFGGSNAHVILEGPPDLAQEPVDSGSRPVLIALSAHSQAALSQRARELADWIEASPGVSLRDLATTLALHRNHLRYRLAFVASSTAEVVEELRARGQKGPRPRHPRRGGERPKVAFVFPGQGSQWPGMGLELYRSEPVFRSRFDAVSEALASHVDWSPLEVLSAAPDVSRLDEIDVVQPVTFALQVALAALWRSWGVEPDAVVGHSLGEVAAACVTGALSLEEGARLICLRSRLMRRVSGQGGMLVVDLPQEDLAELLEPFRGQAEVAVVNSPTAAAVSGNQEALDTIHRRLTEQGVFCRFVKVDVAAHGPQMEPLVDELGAGLQCLSPRAGEVPFISTVAGREVPGLTLNSTYWQKNLRSPVRFLDAISHLLDEGFDTFLELSGHPLLCTPMEQVAESHWGGPVTCLWSLRREEPELPRLLANLAGLYEGHHPIHWQALMSEGGRRMRLPTYPWQREVFWLQRSARASHPMVEEETIGHPLLGRHWQAARRQEVAWQTRLTPATAPFLNDHRVFGSLVFPGTGFVEMALAAAGVDHGAAWCELVGMEMERVLFVSEADLLNGRGPCLETAVFKEGTGERRFEIHGKEEGGEWIRHGRGKILDHRSLPAVAQAFDPSQVRERLVTKAEGKAFYETLEAAGYSYGPRHQGLQEIWSNEEEALAELVVPPEVLSDTGLYQLHPSILDAAWQALAVLLPEFEGAPWIPVGIERHRLGSSGRPVRWVHAQMRPAPSSPEAIILADVSLYADDGQLVAETLGLALRRLQVRNRGSVALQDWLYSVVWAPSPRTGAREREQPATWLLFPDREGMAAALGRHLEERGQKVVTAPAELAEPAAEPAQLRQWLRRAWTPSDPPLRGVLYGWALDLASGEIGHAAGEASEEALFKACHAPAELVRELVLGSGGSPPRLWFLTCNALPTTGTAPPEHEAGSTCQACGERPQGLALRQAPLCGLARVIFNEHPELAGGLVDLDSADSLTVSARLVASEILCEGTEREIAFRGARRCVGRLRRLDTGSAETAPENPLRVRSDATYLITGGSGGLGLECARWLVDQGARSLLLLSRRPTPHASLDDLESLGVQVILEAVDVGDAASVTRVIGSLAARGLPPLKGVMHAAGVVDDGSLLDDTRSRREAVLQPKWSGGWNIHRACDGQDLDFFVVFSSAASVLGNPGQGSYCAANAYLDALCHHRRALGQPAVSVNWGLWKDVGFAVSGAAGQAAHRRLTSQGLASIPTDAGVEILGRLIRGDDPQVLVLPVNWQVLQTSSPALAALPLLADLLEDHRELSTAVRSSLGAEDSEGSHLGDEVLDWETLQGTAPQERRELLGMFLRQRLGGILKMPPSRLPGDEPLTGLGLDSLVAVELRNAMEGGLDHPIPLSWLLQGASLAELTSRILESMETASKTQLEEQGRKPAAETFVSVPTHVSSLPADEAQRLLDRVDDLPPGEVDRLLALMTASSGELS